MIVERLLERLAELAGTDRPGRYLVAFSGGLDSTVLLHALASEQERHRVPVLAVHVNHALQPDAARWQAHCRHTAGALGVGYVERQVRVPGGDPRGIEGAARELRYRAIAKLVRSGDHVLTAHHQDDQAETVLLNLLRGSGVHGLAGAGSRQPLGAGLLLRPFLDVPRAEIAAYAEHYGLAWCDDPSNADLRFDRNFLRHAVLPVLGGRWRAAGSRLARSAALLADAAALLDDLGDIDIAALGGDAARLESGALGRLAPARQRNVLRHALRRLGLPAPPARQLEQVLSELLPAAADAQPLVRWPGAEVRRYRGYVYLLPPRGPARPEAPVLAADGRAVRLGPALGRLVLERAEGRGIDSSLAAGGLRIAFRRGGERLRPAGRAHTHALKKLLQEAGIVPWMREVVPLLYAGDRLVAVADMWIAQHAACERGYAVRWLDKPALD